MSLETAVHHALSNPVRMQLVTVLRATGGGLDVRDLAAETGVHVNTVRAHLNVLIDAGLVGAEPEDRDRPGRPRHIYHATATADDALGGGSYRFLAKVLASYLASAVDDPTRASEQAGEVWGHYMVDGPEPFRQVAPDVGIARVVELLAELGFAPELDEDPEGTRILLRRCPFLDVAREHQDVVCSVHLGLMRGALDELEVEVEVTALLPFVEPSLCVTELTVPAT